MRAVGAEPNAKLAPGASAPASSPVTRDAATVILVSDRPDLHVLMMERTRRAAFGPGATVFPGGAVDPADGDFGAGDRIGGRLVGLDDVTASSEQGIGAGGLAFRVAAVRECFEEAGILLARDAVSGERVDHDPALAGARAELNAGSLTFGDVL